MNEVKGGPLSIMPSQGKISPETSLIEIHTTSERITQSTLFLTSVVVKGTAALTYVAWKLSEWYFPILRIATLGASAVALSSTVMAQRQKLFYEISLGYNLFKNRVSPDKWPKYNQITKNLFLGRLPLKNCDDHKDLLEKEKIGAVLSVIEDYENHSLGIFSDPVTPENWKEMKVNHYQIKTPDFHPLSAEDLENGVKYIDANIKIGKKVYVHCKAGRSRSAAVVVAYLVKSKQFNTLEQAISYIKDKRSIVCLSDDKVKAIKSYLEQK